MRVRNVCALNKVTKTITRTLCAPFLAPALAKAQATDAIGADPSTWAEPINLKKSPKRYPKLIDDIWFTGD